MSRWEIQDRIAQIENNPLYTSAERARLVDGWVKLLREKGGAR